MIDLMKKHLLLLGILVFFLTGITTTASAQFPRLQRKLEEALEDKVVEKMEEELEEDGGLFGEGSSSEESNRTSSPNKIKGEGLSAPDAAQHITQAETQLSEKAYSDARYEVKQALIAIELAIGQEILEKDMPQQVGNMEYRPSEDQVASSGIGFAGLAILRSYKGGNERMQAGVYNNQTMLVQYQRILTNPSYYENSDVQYKTVRVQGIEGSLSFDNNNTYSLGIPFGQNSLFVLECSNFADENEVMAAASSFDLQSIMQRLDEQ